ncbi:MAG: sigma 54-interacting transcriptional regulator [Syntrophobacteraceae bacterium]
MEFEAIHLVELLDFRPDDGSIWLKNERVIIQSVSALGILRKDLILNYGMEAARHITQRMAYAQGYLQGLIMAERYGAKVAVPSGPIIFGLEGLGKVTVVVKISDPDGLSFHEEGIIHRSPDAEQHMLLFGKSQVPVCWNVTGFASGYHSAVRGKLLYFEEETCVARGDSCCHIIARETAGAQPPRQTSQTSATERLPIGDIFGDIRDEMNRKFQAFRKKESRVKPHKSAPGNVDDYESRDGVERAITLSGEDRFIVSDRAMSAAVRAAMQVAPLPTTVLVRGESGTGKEFFAHLIHHHSGRTNAPFVSLNCAALTESLLESELFGHVRGAFTGAIRDKVGLLELARDGTLFLDEVGDMPLRVQAKLLRALELRQIRRVGGEADIKVHARVVAATNVDLPAAVDAGTFRRELYFRLAGFVIHLPALQERREAIPLLAYEFLKRAAFAFRKKAVSISPDAMSRLIFYPWPGNVRELKHAIERAVIVSTAAEIQVGDLPEKRFQNVEYSADSLSLRQNERNMILQALLESKGNRTIAARNLRIDPATLWRKLKRYNIDVPKRSRAQDPDGLLV